MNNKQDILIGLYALQSMGFEVIKSNSGQIAVNNTANTQPLVMNNDINYLTPTPHQWHLITNEIERIKGEQK